MRSVFPAMLTLAMLVPLTSLAEQPGQEPATEYVVKQNAPSPGTNFRRDVVKAGFIPLDKTYAELSPAQKAAVKAQYDNMKDADEPPFPEHGLLPLYQAVANLHEKLDFKYKGVVSIYISIDSKGNATAVSVGKSPDPEVTQDVAQLLVMEKFKPAICNGAPCAQVFPFRAELIGPDPQQLKNGKPSGQAFITAHWP